MDNKKSKAGFVLIIVGITMFFSILLFILLGYDFTLKDGIIFEDDQQKTQISAQTDSISIPGFESWTIKEGEKTVSADFYNPEKNNCYFVLTVMIDSTGEEIYKSNYLKPGQHLYSVELNRALTGGTYEATVHYDTYSVADNTPMNGADVPFTLIVK